MASMFSRMVLRFMQPKQAAALWQKLKNQYCTIAIKKKTRIGPECITVMSSENGFSLPIAGLASY